MINVYFASKLCIRNSATVRKKRSRTPAPLPKRLPKPRLPWQTGEYERHATYHFVVPYPFLLLCRLMDVTPGQVLCDFMDNACGTNRKGNWKEHKSNLAEYFLGQDYGKHIYSEEKIVAMFRELDAIANLFPEGADRSFIEQHTQWRDNYQVYWFEKWMRRRETGDVKRET